MKDLYSSHCLPGVTFKFTEPPPVDLRPQTGLYSLAHTTCSGDVSRRTSGLDIEIRETLRNSLPSYIHVSPLQWIF